jgi:hypothetical protein
MLAAMDKAFAVAGDRISAGERQAVDKYAEEVRRALGSGDRNSLKRANEALDAATQDLAAMVLEVLLADQSRP